MRRPQAVGWLLVLSILVLSSSYPATAQDRTCRTVEHRDPRNPNAAGWIVEEAPGSVLIVHVGNDATYGALYQRVHGRGLGAAAWLRIGKTWQDAVDDAAVRCREWLRVRVAVVTPPQPAEVKPRPDVTADCGKGAALTRYLDALEAHHQAITRLDEELDDRLGRSDRDPRTVAEIGRRAQGIVSAYQNTLVDFRRAETRRGLLDELEFLVDTPILLNKVIVKYQKLAGTPVTPLNPNAVAQSRNEAASMLLGLAKEHLAFRLESEGLRDILTSESWTEALETTAFHARRKVEEFLDRETENILGFGFHDAESAGRALRMQMRREVRRQIARLLVKITSNEIVIELAAGPIIRWIERDLVPRLREALRQKGNFPERVTRSIGTLDDARDSLNALGCDARLSEVRRRLAAAQGTIQATRYLDRDLRDAGAATELARLSEGFDRLNRTIHLTQTRFLLLKDDYEEDLVFIENLVGQMAGILARSIPAR